MSKSTPSKNVTPKTKSAPRRPIILGVIALILLCVAVLVLLNLRDTAGDPNTVTLQTGSRRYTLLLATTQAVQQRGLGERRSLPQDEGMLFIFQQVSMQCFWMKDMHFPLDMIWLSSARRVEYIKASVAPSTYPNTFCPNDQAKYVLELNAGQAIRAGIHRGQTLSF